MVCHLVLIDSYWLCRSRALRSDFEERLVKDLEVLAPGEGRGRHLGVILPVESSIVSQPADSLLTTSFCHLQGLLQGLLVERVFNNSQEVNPYISMYPDERHSVYSGSLGRFFTAMIERLPHGVTGGCSRTAAQGPMCAR